MESINSIEGSSEGKKIRFFVIPEGGSLKSTKPGSASASEPSPSIFFYSNNGTLVPAEILVDGLTESSPENSETSSLIVKKENTPLLIPNMHMVTTKSAHSLEETSSRTVKKLKTNLVTVSNNRSPAIISRTSAIKTTSTNSDLSIPQAAVTSIEIQSIPEVCIPEVHIKRETEPSSKVFITSYGAVKPSSVPNRFKVSVPNTETTSIVQVPCIEDNSNIEVTSILDSKPQDSSLIEHHISLLDDETEKSTMLPSRTVLMRVNSFGELELDPMFLNTDSLESEVHLENSISQGASDSLEVSSLSGVPKTEVQDIAEEIQVDVQSSLPEMESSGGSSATVNQSWFTSREEKEMLRWRGHAWKQGMWSKEETELLQKNIEDYCSQRGLSDPASVIFHMSKEERSGFYRDVAQGLNRPLFSVYRRVIRLYDNRNHIGKYSNEEVAKLRELRMKHGNNWQAIAANLGRSAASVKDRCRLLNEHCNRGAWSTDEEDRLSAAVYEKVKVLPGEQVTSGISWGEVAARVGTRSEKQCRTKWLNYLNWKRTSGVEWCKADDIQLICRLCVSGVSEESQVDWVSLARGWPACRSPHWLRGKWWNLKRKLPSTSTDISLREMCQHLYNNWSMNVLQTTLVELPATHVSSSSEDLLNPSEKCNSPSSGSIKLCIPAANFADIINSAESSEDLSLRLSSLVESALVMPSNDGSNDGTNDGAISHQTSGFHINLSSISNTGVSLDQESLLDQAGLVVGVKGEELLSDGEGTNNNSTLTSSLDPISRNVSSQVILNDPIMSNSGDPLDREEGLRQDTDDSDIPM